MRFSWIVASAWLMIGVAAGAGWAADVPDNGQDPTNPLSRLSLKYQYQNLPPSNHDAAHYVTLRGDKLFRRDEAWAWAARIDLPGVVTDQTGRDNRDGDTEFGFGDVLIQGSVINKPNEAFAWAAGSQFIFPTASQDQMGAGKYRIVPTAAARWMLPRMRDGSWFAAVTRFDADVAGADDRNDIRELQFAPTVNLALPEGWFVNLYPSSDIKYNFAEKRPGDTGKWFIPFDVLVGKTWSNSAVASFEVSFPLLQDYQVYDLKIEASFSFLFG
jgi:hypothetical protein